MTSNCRLCDSVDTVLQVLVKCPIIDKFWREIHLCINKLTGNTSTLTTGLKLFGKPLSRNEFLQRDVIDLLSWTLTIPCCSIHKSAVHLWVREEHTPPNALSRAAVKAHIYTTSTMSPSPETQNVAPIAGLCFT